MEITLLYHLLLIYPRWALLYFTRQAPSYVPQMEIPLIKHSLLIYPDWDSPTTPPLLIFLRWRLPYYTTPANLPEMKIPLLHQTDSLIIYPRWRFPYYTRQAPYEFTSDGDYSSTPDRPLTNWPKMEITVLYQTVPFLCTQDGDYPTPLPSAYLPWWRFPYYSRQAPC